MYNVIIFTFQRKPETYRDNILNSIDKIMKLIKINILHKLNNKYNCKFM